MRYLLLLLPVIARANTIADDAADGAGIGSMPITGFSWILSIFCGWIAIMAIKERSAKEFAIFASLAGVVWINPDVTAMVSVVALCLLPILMVFGGRR